MHVCTHSYQKNLELRKFIKIFQKNQLNSLRRKELKLFEKEGIGDILFKINLQFSSFFFRSCIENKNELFIYLIKHSTFI